MNRISVLKAIPEFSSPLHCMRTHQEGASYKSGKGVSPEHNHADALILDFPAPRTMRKITVVYKLPQSVVLL